MRQDKPRIEMVIRASNEVSHEQARAITLAANMGASVSLYIDKPRDHGSPIKSIHLHRVDYAEVAGRVVKDRSGQYTEYTSKQVTN